MNRKPTPFSLALAISSDRILNSYLYFKCCWYIIDGASSDAEQSLKSTLKPEKWPFGQATGPVFTKLVFKNQDPQSIIEMREEKNMSCEVIPWTQNKYFKFALSCI